MTALLLLPGVYLFALLVERLGAIVVRRAAGHARHRKISRRQPAGASSVRSVDPRSVWSYSRPSASPRCSAAGEPATSTRVRPSPVVTSALDSPAGSGLPAGRPRQRPLPWVAPA